MRWVILGIAAAATIAGCGDEGSADLELGAASDGITLNTTSWSPYEEGASWMEAGIGGIVRVDPNGCVYLGSDRSDLVRDIAWPAGYTASRQSDGSVVIRNPDGMVVAATGHRVDFGGGAVPGIELQCRAQGPRDRSEPGDSGVVMVTDVLPPLKHREPAGVGRKSATLLKLSGHTRQRKPLRLDRILTASVDTP